jgi:hypothetical protein
MISSEKVMITIAWSPDGFHAIEILPKGQKFDVDHFCSFVLPRLSKIGRQFRNERQRKLTLVADNARPDITKPRIEFYTKLGLRVASRPPDSPDLAPSDYFPFGSITDKLKGLSFPLALHPHHLDDQVVRGAFELFGSLFWPAEATWVKDLMISMPIRTETKRNEIEISTARSLG